MEAASPARMGEENMRTSIEHTFYRLEDSYNTTSIDYIDILVAKKGTFKKQ